MSKIREIGKQKLQFLFETSTSYGDVLLKLNMKSSGSNYITLKKIIKEFEIDETNLNLNRLKKQKKNFFFNPLTPLSKILVKNSNYSGVDLKRRLLKEGILKEKCSWCGLGHTWNGKPIVLQLDHINGIRNDNRLENLRILCPNCHTQTDTYAGKSLKKEKIKKFKNCLSCDLYISFKTKTGLCVSCANLKRHSESRNNIIRPNKKELNDLVFKIPLTKIAIIYNVTANSVKKWCKKYDIIHPSNGYWQKLKAGKL